VRNRSVFVIAFIVILLGYIFNITSDLLNEKLVDYFEILSALTALVGVYAIWYQLKRDKDINEAQFLIDLNSKFYENEAIMEVYSKCVSGQQAGSEGSPLFTYADEPKVSQFFSFFGTINNLLERNILDLALIDKTFAYRYFVVANRKELQNVFLIPDAKYYRGNYKLYQKWYSYRKQKNMPIFGAENNLMERNPDGFKHNKDS
jgi:hypothetical protein